jgi:hypothetical protein
VAYLNAILTGANEFDADDIAKVIERRPWPSYVRGAHGGVLADGKAEAVEGVCSPKTLGPFSTATKATR